MYFVFSETGIDLVHDSGHDLEKMIQILAEDFSACIYFEADLCAPDEGSNILRHYYKELQSLNSNGRPCEACERPMHNHVWVDLDTQGFAVRCNFKP